MEDQKGKSSKTSVEVPQGVNVVSILYYVFAALAALGAAAGIILIGIFGVDFSGYWGGLGKLFVGVIFGAVIYAVINFYVAKGLSRAKSWARMVAIVFSIMGALGGLNSLFSGLVGLNLSMLVYGIFWSGVHGWIGWYLLCNEEAKQFFE